MVVKNALTCVRSIAIRPKRHPRQITSRRGGATAATRNHRVRGREDQNKCVNRAKQRHKPWKPPDINRPDEKTTPSMRRRENWRSLLCGSNVPRPSPFHYHFHPRIPQHGTPRATAVAPTLTGQLDWLTTDEDFAYRNLRQRGMVGHRFTWLAGLFSVQ